MAVSQIYRIVAHKRFHRKTSQRRLLQLEALRVYSDRVRFIFIQP